MNKLNLKIVTPQKVIYESLVDEISIATHMGRIGVLPRHIPLVAMVKSGEMIVRKDGIELPMAVSGGILEVKPFSRAGEAAITPVIVLADHLELAHEIDMQRAQEAYDRAKKAMEEKEHVQDVDFAKLQATIEKELNRITIGGKYKRS